MKSRCIMVQGTASSVGKSIIVTGLLRIFKQDGYKVVPFKSQNMALNSFVTKDGKEMGRAQVVQAEAAGEEPDVFMNPILLKPTSDKMSQVIINGEVFRNMSAMEYYGFKPKLADMISEIYCSVARQNDIVAIEGAGSPAEINLKENDIVNMGMAKIADAPVILVGDIDKGGVFASIAGTMLLLNEEERQRVKGVIINKFRGDINILKPGLEAIEDIIKVPVLGVVPYFKLNIDDEDSITDRFKYKSIGSSIDIAIIKLPHISNFTDFVPLENLEDTSIRYVDSLASIGNPDILILPGSKNTIKDILYLKREGIFAEIIKFHQEGGIVFGICGGYQMLGGSIEDEFGVESDIRSIDGLGLLNTRTILRKNKETLQVRGEVCTNSGLMSGMKGKMVTGYEIHMGNTEIFDGCIHCIEIEAMQNELGCGKNNPLCICDANFSVYGTYMHGIFDNMDFSQSLINNIRKKKGLEEIKGPVASYSEYKQQQYDRLADILRANIDVEKIYDIIFS